VTRTVYMMPTPEQALADTTNAIHQIVLKLQKHLPAFGYALVEDAHGADLVVGHAGQGANGVVDVAHCHGLYPTATGSADGWHWGANRAVISNLIGAKQITVPSEWVADILRRDMHVAPHVVGWAIESEQWQPGSDHQGYVLWNKTRRDQVCDPMPVMNLAAICPEQRFITTFGEGTPNLRTVGRQRYEDMAALIRGAEVYLATTKETFGIGTLEAMACGIPVLGYRWGGTADLVEHGVSGYLVEPGDVDGLREGLGYCKQFRTILGANARAKALTYTWDKVAAQIAAVYDLALEPHVGPKVSVVIPCHNYARFVGEAIESVRRQEANFVFEIIVVNDGSTDNSSEVIGNALDGVAACGVVVSQTASGPATARNMGIDRARGTYVVCLDADDRLGSAEYLQTLADALDADRALGIAFTSITMMTEDGTPGSVSQWPHGYSFDGQAEGRNQVPTCCMFRREAWQRAGGYRGAYEPAEDAELWLRIGALGYRAKHVTEAGMFWYRLHGQSLSASVRSGQKREPDWRAAHPWARDGQRPFAADGQPRPNPHSWPVRNYDQPLVSFVVPVGPGHARYVNGALDSIEAQTERRWECIVVNDSGEPFALPGHTWARVLQTEGATGASHARNLGLHAARGKLIAFLDADDLLNPRFLELALKGYARSGRYVYTDWVSLNKRGEYEPHETPAYIPGEVFQRTSIHSINVLIPRRWLLDVDGFDETMTTWEDVDLFMKLAARGYCGERVAEPLVLYRYGTGRLRETGEPIKEELKALLRERYHEYIVEGKEVVCCGSPPQKAVAAPIPGAGGDVTDDMVRVEYTGPWVPEARQTLRGAVTNTFYGERARGDIFFVWKKDFDAMPDKFVALAPVEGIVEPTPVPPAPTLVSYDSAAAAD
jgi:glycosyltransferase involved in cell wall biosynthesis